MQQAIEGGLVLATTVLINQGVLPPDSLERIAVERTRDRSHGDFATNLALAVAKSAKRNPREIAQLVVDYFPESPEIESIQIAGPGFINFTLAKDSHSKVIGQIKSAGAHYGVSDLGAKKKVMVEYVSANPTGPLHVGHGRGAAYGDALVRLLRATGFDVASEYYFNDAGRQMQILAQSVFLRYLSLAGQSTAFPTNAYQGDYIWDIAATVHRENSDALVIDANALFANLPDDVEKAMDVLIKRSQEALGGARYKIISEAGPTAIVENIRTDLKQFGVQFDCWFSEGSLVESGDLGKAINALKEKGYIYEEGGAWWFRSTEFGDDKDRVVIRSNGQHTYFAADIAYLLNKSNRGFEQLIYIWGADHHGTVARVRAAFEAQGKDPDSFKVLLVQFANLFRGEEKVSMSTRSGEYVTLRELREEVGKDAARFFYVMRKPEQHMDFDLELAKSKSNENPVYYVQYAHARVCSVFRQLQEKGLSPAEKANLALLTEDHEVDLMIGLSKYPEILARASRDYAPHQVAYYLRDLAHSFHTYYNAHPFIGAEDEIRHARLALIDAVRQIISNGLQLLGVNAPERM